MYVGRLAGAQWVGRKTESQRVRWATEQALMNEAFATHEAARVDARGGPGAIVIRPIVTDLEPGYYAYIAKGRTRLRMRVQLLDERGTLLEEVAVEDAVKPHAWSAGSGPRLVRASAALGDRLGAYLSMRR